MFRRRQTEQQTATDPIDGDRASTAEAGGGKGRPTLSRKQAEADYKLMKGVVAEWRQRRDAGAGKLAGKAPRALAAAKSSVNVGGEMPQPLGLEYELREFLLLFGTEDQKEGMRAFLEKRPARYVGR